MDVKKFDMSEPLRKKLMAIENILYEYDSVTEVMSNSDGNSFVESGGRLISISKRWSVMDTNALMRLLAAHYDRVVNEKTPVLEARLPWSRGGRFEGLVPPVVSQPCFSIRFPPSESMSLDDLSDSNTLTVSQASYLEEAVSKRKNIVVSGGTGSGKTTIANALLATIDDGRVLVLEDNPEIRLRNKNTDYYQTSENFSLRDAVRVCMRMRPDRIVVGELRDGGAALDTLKAWSTGHPGGISTIHAGGARGVFNRLMSLMGEVVVSPSGDLVKEAVDVRVHVQKEADEDGIIRRRVTEIIEGWDKVSEVELQS